MAGLIALIGGLLLTGNEIKNSVSRDVETKYARELAIKNNEELYYDGYNNPHWTETGELVEVDTFLGGCTIIGKKTKIIYKNEPNILQKKETNFEEAIKYCRDNNIEYLPWYYPNSIFGRTPGCTGIEVKTGKKYICTPGFEDRDEIDWTIKINKYYLIYLENKPHDRYSEYGSFREYDGIHDGSKELKSQNFRLCSEEKHYGKGKDKNYTYYTRRYIISEEEYHKRTTPLEKYPYDFEKLPCF